MTVASECASYWMLVRRHRNFRLFWLSEILAYLAIWTSTIVLLHVVHEAMDSNIAQGLLLTSQFLPAFFLMPLASHILDRYDRRRIIIASKVCNGGLALVLLVWASVLPVWSIFAISVLYGLSITLFVVAGGTVLPQTVTREELTRANILMRVTPSMMMVVSGGFLSDPDVSIEGHGELLIVAILFFVSAAVFSRVRDLGHDVEPDAPGPAEGVLRTFVAGLKYLAGHRELARAFAIRMTLYVGVGGQVLLSIYAEEVFENGESGTGLLYMARGIGMLIGGFGLAQLVLSKGERNAQVIGLGLILFGAGYALASTASGFGMGAIALVLGLGFVGEGVVKPLTMTLLQQHTEPAYLARVMAAEQGLSSVVQSVAALVIAASVTTGDPGDVLRASAATGGLLIVVAAAWLVMTWKQGPLRDGP